jgi:hypothetical protein
MTAASKGMLIRRRLWTWRFVIIVALAVAICIAVIAISRHAFPLRHQKEFVEKRLSRLLGFTVSIHGPVVMRLSLRPSINVKDVHMRQPEGDSKLEPFTAKDVSVRLELLPLLSNKWSIRRLEVTDAELCMSVRPGSPCDWRRALAAIDQVTNVDEVTVRGLKVSCHGGPCGKTLQRDIALISASFPAAQPTKVSVQAKEDEKPFAILSGGTWSEFRANRPWRTQASLRSERMRVEIAGTIREPRQLHGIDLTVDGRAQLGRWHGVALGEPHIRGRLVDDANGYRFQMKDSKWGTGTVTGEVKAKRTRDGLQISGTTAARRMDLDPWMEEPAQGQAAGGYVDGVATFTTTGNSIDEWLEHVRGSARVDAGPAEVPIDQVERWSQGFLKFVLSLPAEGAVTRVRCIGGDFDLHGGRAMTSNLRIDAETTRMRGVGTLSLGTGEIDLLVKPTLKHGPLKDAPLVRMLSMKLGQRLIKRCKSIFPYTQCQPTKGERHDCRQSGSSTD